MSLARKQLPRNYEPMMLKSAAVSEEPSGRQRGTSAIAAPSVRRPTLRFAPFEVNTDSCELRKHGMRIRLEEKSFQVLELLLEQPGKLVSREALCARLWPDTFVGYDHCLNTAVNKLRAALGDSALFRFVETVRRRGYRFVASVTEASASPSVARRRVLLVLPFGNLAPRPARDFFNDSLTEELIAQIGRLDPERLGVIARTTAMHYKRVHHSIGRIGRELDVAFVLEGAVRRSGQRLRVGAHLIRVSDQTQIWSEIYERQVTDFLDTQIEIAEAIARALAIELDLRAFKTHLPKFGPPISIPRRLQQLGS